MQKLEYSQTNYFSKLVIDYLNGDEKLKPFYKYALEISSFKKVIEDKSKEKINRKILVEVLKEQYATIKQQPPGLNNLLNENTFTVTTGHQLCLFTGPLYFIYKIFSTINLADELKRNFPDYNFVPVYWMVSEDADFEEISSVNMFGKNVKWQIEKHENVIAGKLTCEKIRNTIATLKDILDQSENAKYLLKLFSDSYLQNKNLADATRFLVNEFFGKYGLVIIDGNDVRLKSEFPEFMKDDILTHINYQLVSETNEELKNLGYKIQVNPREINCFYLKEDSRDKIVNKNFEFRISNFKLEFSEVEMKKLIENHPENFSPNVVLRPLYQEKILPNVAYIGGGAEISYWLEYKKMFEHHKINFPVLVLRNSVMLVDKKSSERLKKFNIDYSDLFNETDILTKNFLEKCSTNISLHDEKEKLKTVFGTISAKAEIADSTLKQSVQAELQKTIHSLENIEKKLLKAEKHKNETEVNQIKKIKEKLFPNGNLQERFENFIPYYLIYGEHFFNELKKNLNPVEKFFLIISY